MYEFRIVWQCQEWLCGTLWKFLIVISWLHLKRWQQWGRSRLWLDHIYYSFLAFQLIFQVLQKSGGRKDLYRWHCKTFSKLLVNKYSVLCPRNPISESILSSRSSFCRTIFSLPSSRRKLFSSRFFAYFLFQYWSCGLAFLQRSHPQKFDFSEKR